MPARLPQITYIILVKGGWRYACRGAEPVREGTVRSELSGMLPAEWDPILFIGQPKTVGRPNTPGRDAPNHFGSDHYIKKYF